MSSRSIFPRRRRVPYGRARTPAAPHDPLRDFVDFPLDEIVAVAKFGDPIYPVLEPIDKTRGLKTYCDEYRNIVLSASTVSALPYILPDRPFDGSSGKGEKYSRHLFVTEQDGSIRFDLNNWERKTIGRE